jgi:hypothetical protein
MSALFIAQIGTFNFADYVRVGPSDGLDPYGKGWAEPQFADAAFGAGQPLTGVSVGNREMVWPLYLNRNFLLPEGDLTPEETLLMEQHIHELVVDMNRALAAPGLQLQWCDAHAPAVTYYDVAFARFDPEYNYRQDQFGWKAGTLRVWCNPPYGHTGTYRIVGTSAGGSGMVQVINTPSLVGDTDAAVRARITAPAVGTLGNSGRIVGYAGLPNATYPARWPAASMTMEAGATITTAGASDMQDGQFVRFGAGAETRAKFSVELTPASQFHGGRHRVFAFARPMSPVGLAVTADLEGVPLGATGLATSPLGLSVVDLGAFETSADDPRGSLRLNIQTQRPYDVSLPPSWEFRSGVGNPGVFPGVNQIVVVPEAHLSVIVDGSERSLGEDGFANTPPYVALLGTVALDGTYDHAGNQWHLATLAQASNSLKEYNDGSSKGVAAGASQHRAGAVLGHRPVRDMRAVAYTSIGILSPATHGLAAVCKTFDGDVTPAATGRWIEGQLWMGYTPWVALLSRTAGGTTLHASAALTLTSATLFAQARIELACRGPQMSFSVVEMGATTPAMACIGASIGGLEFAGRAAIVGNWNQKFMHAQVAESPRHPVGAGDNYWLGDRSYVEASGAASVARIIGDPVGALPAAPVDGAAVAFCAPLDANNALSTTAVEIRAQERFNLAR